MRVQILGCLPRTALVPQDILFGDKYDIMGDYSLLLSQSVFCLVLPGGLLVWGYWSCISGPAGRQVGVVSGVGGAGRQAGRPEALYCLAPALCCLMAALHLVVASRWWPSQARG